MPDVAVVVRALLGGRVVAAHLLHQPFHGVHLVGAQHHQPPVAVVHNHVVPQHPAQAGDAQEVGRELLQFALPPAVLVRPEEGLREAERLDGVVHVVLRVHPIADGEELDVLEQPAVGPEALALVADDLVEGLLQLQSAALQLHLHHGQAVAQDGDIVAVGVAAHIGHLLGHLPAVGRRVATIEEAHVGHRAVLPLQGVAVPQDLAAVVERALLQVVQEAGHVPLRE